MLLNYLFASFYEERDFAPHEVAQASRQRCIIDVRARFLSDLAA